MKNGLILFFLSYSFLFTQSDQMSADDIMKAMDKNLNANSRIMTSKMVVKGRRNNRTIESKNWVVGTELAFTEYLSPPREAGTKMLKIGEKLYTYSPQTDRVIQISGHMLRQSVMGSDMSLYDISERHRGKRAPRPQLPVSCPLWSPTRAGRAIWSPKSS